MRKFPLVAIVFLTGCLLSPKNEHKGEVQQTGPVVTVNAPSRDPELGKSVRESAEGVKTEVNTRMKTVQDALSGLITGKIDELDARLALSAQLSAVVQAIGKIETTINGNVSNSADFRAQLSAVVQAIGKLETVINGNVTNSADFRAQLKGLSDNLVSLRADLRLSVDGVQTGIANRIDKVQQDIKSTAGRDVNYLPKEAVEAMEFQYKITIAVVLALKVILLTFAGYVYKSTRAREENYAKLLMRALGELDPDKARALNP